MKICKQCKVNPAKKAYCSAECSYEAKKIKDRKYAKNRYDSRHTRYEPQNKLCLHCNKSFIAKVPFAVYCNVSCRYEAQIERGKNSFTEARCVFCDNVFVKSVNKRIFCSDTCRKSYHYTPKEITKCVICNSDVLSKRKYCSPKCANVARNNIQRGLPVNTTTKECVNCGDSFSKLERPRHLTCKDGCKKTSDTPVIVPKSKVFDKLTERWELLWRLKPELQPLMIKIEEKIPLW